MAGFGGAVKLTGENEYKKALTQITQELKVVSSQMKNTATAFDSGDKSQKEVAESAKEMKKALEEQKKALEAVKNKLPALTTEYEKAKAKHKELSDELKIEEKTLESIKKVYGETSTEYKTQQKLVGELSNEVSKSAKDYERLGKDVNNAKIQINNAEATINQTSKALDELGKESVEAGKDAEKGSDGFTVMKGVLANLATDAIRVALSGLKQLTGALIDTGKQAIASYAEFEQLEGGVKKIFGDDVAETVKANAQDAFKTAGLSANEYMETITSFSASLIAGLDGDTAAAANIADRAIRDMSDNANTFGTDMQSIQTAYQGFAKGNFQLLDNLKLGYGGTKTEMLRLVKDAGVVEQSVKSLDDVSFAQIIEGISIIQEQMNITGTTAKEASGTIEGATGSMKAAWQNLLTGMADENSDFEKLSNDFINTLITPDGKGGAIGNLVPRISTVIGGMGQAISTMIPALISGIAPMISDTLPVLIESVKSAGMTLVGMLPGIIGQITDLLPQIISSMDEIISGMAVAGIRAILALGEGIKDSIPLLMAEFPVILSDLIEIIYDWMPDIIDMGIEIINALVDGLIEAIPVLVERLPVIISSIVDTISYELPKILRAGKDILLKLVAGMKEGIPELLQMLPTIITDTVNSLMSMLPEIVATGTELIQGLIDGIVEALPLIIENLPMIIETIINVLTDNLPLIMEAGVTILTALINGVLKALPKLVAMVPKLISTLLTELTKALPKLLLMGGKLLGELISGIGKALPQLLKSAVEIVTTIVDEVKKLPEKMKEFGLQLVKGLWEGISDAVGWLKDKIAGFGDDVANAVKDAFGIKSPSKLFRDEIGKNLALGLGVGFADEMRAVSQQMSNSIPTSFDTTLNTPERVGTVAAATAFDDMVSAFKEALYQVKIELDGEQMGEFVNNTTSQLLYA